MEEVSGLSKRFARKLPRPMVEKQLPTLNNREKKKSVFRFLCGCSNPRYFAETFDGYCNKHGGASERSVA